MVPARVGPDGKPRIRLFTADQYATNFGPVLDTLNFFEREVGRATQVFGNIAHVFSVYESRHAITDPEPFERGVNSFELVNDGKRWWIVSVTWDDERAGNPIPREWLGKE